MSRAYSHSFAGEKYPQYACVLGVLSGGVAFVLTQLGDPLVPWLCYALAAALFASIWPDRAQHWSIWLCLPIFFMLFFDLVTTWSAGMLFRNVITLTKALSAACLGAYAGSKLSLRRAARRHPNKRAKKKRIKHTGSPARNNLVSRNLVIPKQLPAYTASIEVGLSDPGAKATPRALLTGARLQDLNDALIEAAQEGDLDRIDLLVAGGADVNGRSSEQWRPSMIAGLGGDARMLKALFGEGVMAALDASGGQGWTALMIATIEGRVEVVHRLLEKGARVDARSNSGWTALRFAVSMDETEILRVLLDAGADVDRQDHEGKTALMQAAGENIRESLKLLLDAGASPLVKDDKAQTALMLAQKQGHPKIIKLLKEAEAKVLSEISASSFIADGGDSKLAAQTHRVIRIPRDQYYGLMDRYEVIPIETALPSGCEETGREGNEEECRDYAWRNSIGQPSELGWWLGFSNQINA